MRTVLFPAIAAYTGTLRELSWVLVNCCGRSRAEEYPFVPASIKRVRGSL